MRDKVLEESVVQIVGNELKDHEGCVMESAGKGQTVGKCASNAKFVTPDLGLSEPMMEVKVESCETLVGSSKNVCEDERKFPRKNSFRANTGDKEGSLGTNEKQVRDWVLGNEIKNEEVEERRQPLSILSSSSHSSYSSSASLLSSNLTSSSSVQPSSFVSSSPLPFSSSSSPLTYSSSLTPLFSNPDSSTSPLPILDPLYLSKFDSSSVCSGAGLSSDMVGSVAASSPIIPSQPLGSRKRILKVTRIVKVKKVKGKTSQPLPSASSLVVGSLPCSASSSASDLTKPCISSTPFSAGVSKPDVIVFGCAPSTFSIVTTTTSSLAAATSSLTGSPVRLGAGIVDIRGRDGSEDEEMIDKVVEESVVQIVGNQLKNEKVEELRQHHEGRVMESAGKGQTVGKYDSNTTFVTSGLGLYEPMMDVKQSCENMKDSSKIVCGDEIDVVLVARKNSFQADTGAADKEGRVGAKDKQVSDRVVDNDYKNEEVEEGTQSIPFFSHLAYSTSPSPLVSYLNSSSSVHIPATSVSSLLPFSSSSSPVFSNCDSSPIVPPAPISSSSFPLPSSSSLSPLFPNPYSSTSPFPILDPPYLYKFDSSSLSSGAGLFSDMVGSLATTSPIIPSQSLGTRKRVVKVKRIVKVKKVKAKTSQPLSSPSSLVVGSLPFGASSWASDFTNPCICSASPFSARVSKPDVIMSEFAPSTFSTVTTTTSSPTAAASSNLTGVPFSLGAGVGDKEGRDVSVVGDKDGRDGSEYEQMRDKVEKSIVQIGHNEPTNEKVGELRKDQEYEVLRTTSSGNKDDAGINAASVTASQSANQKQRKRKISTLQSIFSPFSAYSPSSKLTKPFASSGVPFSGLTSSALSSVSPFKGQPTPELLYNFGAGLTSKPISSPSAGILKPSFPVSETAPSPASLKSSTTAIAASSAAPTACFPSFGAYMSSSLSANAYASQAESTSLPGIGDKDGRVGIADEQMRDRVVDKSVFQSFHSEPKKQDLEESSPDNKEHVMLGTTGKQQSTTEYQLLPTTSSLYNHDMGTSAGSTNTKSVATDLVLYEPTKAVEYPYVTGDETNSLVVATRNSSKFICSEVNDVTFDLRDSLIVNQIMAKYGDITSGSILKSMAAKSTMLQLVVDVVRRLHNNTLDTLDHDEMKLIQTRTADAVAVRFHVGWLQQRVNKVAKAFKFQESKVELDRLGEKIDAAKRSLAELELQQIVRKEELDFLKGEIERKEFNGSNLGGGLL